MEIKIVPASLVVSFLLSAAAHGNIVFRGPICFPNPFVPDATVYRLDAVLIDCFLPQPFDGPFPGPNPNSFFEFLDVVGYDFSFVNPLPSGWKLSVRNTGAFQTNDNPTIPNLLFQYDNPQAPRIDGPADLGVFRFQTLSATPIGEQRFVALVYNLQTDEPVVQSGSFVFVPTPGVITVALAGLVAATRRRRR